MQYFQQVCHIKTLILNMCVDVSSKGCHLLKILHSPLNNWQPESAPLLSIYSHWKQATQIWMPFRQVHEPSLFVLHNILYLSTVPQGADGCFLTVTSTLSISAYLITICLLSMSQTGKEKHFSHLSIIQPSWLEELIFLLSIFHSHCIDRLIQLICQQLIE